MSDDAGRPPYEPPPPRAAARLAARYAAQPPHPEAELPPDQGDSSPEGANADQPEQVPGIAAPWPEPSGERLVLPDAVQPEVMFRDEPQPGSRLSPRSEVRERLVDEGDGGSGLVPTDVPLADDVVAGFQLPASRPVVPDDPPSDDSGAIPFALPEKGESIGAPQASDAAKPRADAVAAAALAEPVRDASVEDGLAAAAVEDAPLARASGRRRPHGAAMRATYAAMVALAIAVPVLGWLGFHLLSTSTNGTLVTRHHSSGDPGYRALVDNTPTMLVVQRSADGDPVSVTLLALSSADGKGGSVIQVPLDTMLDTPLPRISTIRDGYVASGMSGLVAVTAQVLTTGVGETLDVDDARLAALVAPVAPLRIQNPTSIELPDGRTIEAGDVELAAADFGPFLAARGASESDLDRLARDQVAWQAWIDAVHNSKAKASVPGEATSGIGKFMRALAAGPVEQNTLPVSPVDGTGELRPDPVLLRLMMTQAVPFPVAAVPGQRLLVRVLSGVPGTPVPSSVLQRLVYAGAQISELGNYKAGAEQKTTLRYVTPSRREDVEMMRKYLGAGSLEVVPDTGDSVGVTIIVGKDILDHPPGGLTPAELGR